MASIKRPLVTLCICLILKIIQKNEFQGQKESEENPFEKAFCLLEKVKFIVQKQPTTNTDQKLINNLILSSLTIKKNALPIMNSVIEKVMLMNYEELGRDKSPKKDEKSNSLSATSYNNFLTFFKAFERLDKDAFMKST
mmetsp:Transcript_9554/g.9157  ORF Transcript_9554/g.9157 Transcript_9554/m.9157 type:complete len:139 (-) Transcript_9554:348-764(-)